MNNKPNTQNAIILGFDPGGESSVGFACIEVDEHFQPQKWFVESKITTEQAIRKASLLAREARVVGLGVSSLTCYSSAQSGFRQVDRLLKRSYPAVHKAVASPNSIRGSVIVQGLLMVRALKALSENLVVAETLPSLLHYEIFGHIRQSTEIKTSGPTRIGQLDLPAGEPIDTLHGWDALLSAWACLQWIQGAWKADLHSGSDRETEVHLFGKTIFPWPCALR